MRSLEKPTKPWYFLLVVVQKCCLRTDWKLHHPCHRIRQQTRFAGRIKIPHSAKPNKCCQRESLHVHHVLPSVVPVRNTPSSESRDARRASRNAPRDRHCACHGRVITWSFGCERSSHSMCTSNAGEEQSSCGIICESHNVPRCHNSNNRLSTPARVSRKLCEIMTNVIQTKMMFQRRRKQTDTSLSESLTTSAFLPAASTDKPSSDGVLSCATLTMMRTRGATQTKGQKQTQTAKTSDAKTARSSTSVVSPHCSVGKHRSVPRGRVHLGRRKATTSGRSACRSVGLGRKRGPKTNPRCAHARATSKRNGCVHVSCVLERGALFGVQMQVSPKIQDAKLARHDSSLGVIIDLSSF